ncbi:MULTISPECIES: GvpL/GvpF family gas vesicle protein [Pseudanabaena]|uniref:Gas vesicle synthesis GvpLGvpF n=2 Tax=Pseudanabaena TaxID=1152 RepID=L8N264_9CYAN|nr:MULTISPECIES: GvpL/GvpF family gas vesicle protein [Pseudanabaena]ELS33771.1 Gas vesicle synthesis GvpLGvpF [Pseudanabaena biceps PCC 7429]MDG3493993.1 GvpL/GvpF family gas vesicle protein [Pseudanabaena catenata USMAC16]
MLYTYAILLAPVPENKPLGIKGKSIQYLPCDRLVAAIEADVDIEALKLLPESALMQAIVLHDRLICELFSERTLLPLRFGTAFVSIEALEAYLRTESVKLLANLQKLEGYAEFLITGSAIAPKAEAAKNLKGKDYLLAKRSQYLQQEQWRSQLQQEALGYLQILSANLSPESQAEFQQVETQGSETLRVYALLPRSQVELIQKALQSWESQHSHWQIAWSQALPPYHFLN